MNSQGKFKVLHFLLLGFFTPKEKLRWWLNLLLMWWVLNWNFWFFIKQKKTVFNYITFGQSIPDQFNDKMAIKLNTIVMFLILANRNIFVQFKNSVFFFEFSLNQIVLIWYENTKRDVFILLVDCRTVGGEYNEEICT